jgi:WD40 repeat protein
LSSDGKWLASANEDNTIKVWDLKTGKETLTLRGHTGPVTMLAISGDGKRLCSASGDHDHPYEINGWDLETGKATFSILRRTGCITSLNVSPDGKRIVLGSSKEFGFLAPRPCEIEVLDAEMGEKVLILKGHMHPIASVAFSADGQRIISGGLGTVKVWDAPPGP